MALGVNDQTIGDLASRIESGAITPLGLAEATLDRIEKRDGQIGAFVHVDTEQVLTDALAATQAIAAGNYLGKLHGIPVGVKDIIDVARLPTAGNALVHAQRIVLRDAPVVERLRRAGAVIVGKTRTHEYAFGITTPGTANPWGVERIPGGSSGGSGAALAAGMSLGALGTDTGGSVRIPAALCGVVGLKPTFGVVPKSGVVPLSWALDTVGPMARSVDDVRLLLSAIAGAHGDDASTVERPLSKEPDSIRLIRVGVSTEFGTLEPAVLRAHERAITELANAGASIHSVTTPDVSHYGAAIWATVLPEAAAYHKADLRATPHLYGDTVRNFLEIGSMFLASDYIAAQRFRSVAVQEWKKVFSGIDVLLAPTVPAAAPLRGQEVLSFPDGSKESFLNACMRSVSSASFIGLPAVSVPSGVDEHGMPLALQVTARPFEDMTALLVAESIERIFGRLGTSLQGDA